MPEPAVAAPQKPETEPDKAAAEIVYAEPAPGVLQDLTPGSPEAKARQVLEKLLESDSRSDFTQLVHEPAEVLTKFPLERLHPTPRKRLLFDASEKMPQSNLKYHLFRVVTDDVPLGFPVAIEDTENGPRIDYGAFIQCRDQLLDKFMGSPSAKSEPFLVTLRRGHYFENQLPQAELDQLICFEIASPNPSSPRHSVFIQRGTELGRLALNKYTWDRLYTPILELSGKGNGVHITNLLGDKWQKPRQANAKPQK